MELTQEQIEIEAQNYLNGLDLPENADKQLILDNFKNGMAWAMMLIKEDKQQVMADKKNTISNEEYAIELAENISPYDIGGDNAAHYAAKDAALEAMDWKDEQFKTQKQQTAVWEAKTDKDMIWCIIDTLNHCGVTKHGFEVKDMVAWLEELERNL